VATPRGSAGAMVLVDAIRARTMTVRECQCRMRLWEVHGSQCDRTFGWVTRDRGAGCAPSAPIYDPARRPVRQWHTVALMPPGLGLSVPILAPAAQGGVLGRNYVR